MSCGTDSSIADENDYVNSGCRKKKQTHLLRDMKWVNGGFTMLFWWLIEILFTATLHFTSTEIPDYAQINDKLYTFSQTFLAKEPIYNLTLEIYVSFLPYVCCFYYCCCKLSTKYWVAETHCHWIDFFKYIYIYRFFHIYI